MCTVSPFNHKYDKIIPMSALNIQKENNLRHQGRWEWAQVTDYVLDIYIKSCRIKESGCRDILGTPDFICKIIMFFLWILRNNIPNKVE